MKGEKRKKEREREREEKRKKRGGVGGRVNALSPSSEKPPAPLLS